MVLGAITPSQGPQTRIVQPNVSSQAQTAAPSYVPDTAKTPAGAAAQGEFADYIKKYGAYVAIGVLLLLLLNKNN